MQYHRGSVSDIGQGKMLGGSSSMSYMAYVRGNPSDYDHWATLTDDKSWSFESVFPLFIRSEGVLDPGILKSTEDRALHGLNGTFKLTKYYDKIRKKYFSAFEEMGHKIVPDINVRNPLGFTTVLFSYGNHERSSTAKFLRPVMNNPNLDVLTNSLVTKILFNDEKIAVGVTIKTKDGKRITVKVKKEVIITAGVFKTPQLLMLSGIGPNQHLRKKKIKVIKDLPVGRNLQDHPICVTVFKMGKARRPRGPPDPHEVNIPAIDGYIAYTKHRKNPDYEILSLIIDDPNVFLTFCSISLSFTNEVCDNIIKQVAGHQIYLVFNLLAYPESRGQVVLNTTNIEDQPLITLAYYSNDSDLKKQVKAVLDFNKVLNTTYFKRVGAELIDPKLDDCAGFHKYSNEYWRCYALGMVTTGHYYAGTCAMGQVVDSKLLVKGVKRLRVADASIMPTIVASPTQAAVLMIAQKTVDMIVKEHSLY